LLGLFENAFVVRFISFFPLRRGLGSLPTFCYLLTSNPLPQNKAPPIQPVFVPGNCWVRVFLIAFFSRRQVEKPPFFSSFYLDFFFLTFTLFMKTFKERPFNLFAHYLDSPFLFLFSKISSVPLLTGIGFLQLLSRFSLF